MNTNDSFYHWQNVYIHEVLVMIDTNMDFWKLYNNDSLDSSYAYSIQIKQEWCISLVFLLGLDYLVFKKMDIWWHFLPVCIIRWLKKFK